MRADGYRVGVVGVGMVGEELISVLEERRFPLSELRIMARSERVQMLAGRERKVVAACEEVFGGLDLVLFAGTEGAAGASQLYGWGAVEKGAFVVDNGNDFRMDERVPLVVPEVNAEAMRGHHQGFIANPNCSTIQMVMVLAPLHHAAGLKRVVVSTYQSVSGSGRGGLEALMSQRRAAAGGGEAELGPYAHPVYDNVIPHIGSLKDDFPGYYSEEVKMIRETRKIMALPGLAITATCVRVPVAKGHSEALNVELEEELSPEDARRILSEAPGVVVVDEPAEARYPLPTGARDRDPVYVGRIRKDPSRPRTLDLWCAADNIRKGAALNAVQIAEKAIEMGLL